MQEYATQKINKRVHTPTVLQMEAVECGAAALGIILAYFKKFVPLEQLRVDCGISRDGSKAEYIVQAAKLHGLEPRAMKVELPQLQQCQLPYIVFWNMNHFLVVEGYDKRYVYLNDPATGPRTVSHEEFNDCFTGIVLAFHAGESFKTGGRRKSILAAVRNRLSGQKSSLLFLWLCGLLLMLPSMVVPVFSKLFVDGYLVNQSLDIVKPLLVGMSLTALILWFLNSLQKLYLLKLESKLAITSTSHFIWHVLRLPINFYSQRYAGDISHRTLLNNQVSEVITRQFMVGLLDIVAIILFVALMFLYDVFLTCITLAFAVLNIVILKWVYRIRQDKSLQLITEQGKLEGSSLSCLKIIESLKATGRENDAFAKIIGYETKVINSNQQLQGKTMVANAAPSLLASLATAALLTFGGLRVLEGALTLGTLVAMQSLMTSFLAPLGRLISMSISIQQMVGHIAKLDDVTHYPLEKFANTENTGLQWSEDSEANKLSGAIKIIDVSFGYNNREKALFEQLSFCCSAGERITVVGSSGSGKSTIAKLLLNLYKPWTGEILFDNKPIDAINREILVHSVAMVDQEIFLFNGSLRDNLTLWDKTIDDITLVNAARDACIHEEIIRRPHGYECLVDEGGKNFSGGQQQRFEIARALIKNPSILVMDEATSALDPMIEAEIYDRIKQRGCTTIVIAHRLSTIRDSDYIIVLDKGVIAEQGTHEQLLEKNGVYLRLIGAGGAHG